MAWMFGPDGRPQQEGKFGIGAAIAQDVTHGCFIVGEEAVPYRPVRSEPKAVARPTKGLRDARDEADLTDPVGEAKALCWSATGVPQWL